MPCASIAAAPPRPCPSLAILEDQTLLLLLFGRLCPLWRLKHGTDGFVEYILEPFLPVYQPKVRFTSSHAALFRHQVLSTSAFSDRGAVQNPSQPSPITDRGTIRIQRVFFLLAGTQDDRLPSLSSCDSLNNFPILSSPPRPSCPPTCLQWSKNGYIRLTARLQIPDRPNVPRALRTHRVCDRTESPLFQAL